MRLSLTVNRLRSVNMFTANFKCFYLSLIFASLAKVALSTPVNKTSADGKVFITGDHNEVVVSTAQETKMALTQIKSEVNSLNEKDEKFSERMLSLENTVELLEKYMGRKLNWVNQSNEALSVQVQAMSQRLTTLEKQGIHATYFNQVNSLVIKNLVS